MLQTTIPAGLERRTEDYRLITGHALYVDDLRPSQGRPAALHMAVVRSPYAHAEAGDIRLDEAKALPGVVAIFAGQELVGDMRPMETIPLPGLKKPERRPLALGRVRYVGDPVAVVLAESLAIAEDARDLVDYQGWRAKQRERREAGGVSLPGIGMATFVEISGGAIAPNRPGIPQESATVRIRRDGSILVQSGVATNGQGHFTTFAQLAATTFKLPAAKIEVRMNDTDLPAYGFGTFGSRTLQVAGSAVLLAAEAAREKALQLAARLLEADPADLVLEHGSVMVQGVPARKMELGELARRVEEEPDLIEHDVPTLANGKAVEGLAAWREFFPPNATFSSGTHVALVEVNTDTGDVQLVKYVAVDDCGRVLNRYLVEAQVHGALAQGIGQALYEEVMYDDASGQLLTGTLMDYTLPIAGQLPDFVTEIVETPSPLNPLGAKGVGEAGCIGAPPAIVNAVLDALAPLGIKTIDMPLKPEKVWTLIQAARAGKLEQSDATPPDVFTTGGKLDDDSRPAFL